MSIAVMVLGSALVLWAYASRNCASLLGYIEMSTESKYALDRMSQQVRNGLGVESCSVTQLTIFIPGKTGNFKHRMVYSYDQATQKVIETLKKNPGADQSRTLLTGCTNFSFSVFQRTPISNSFNLYTNAWNTNTAKVVQMQWTCLRRITGDKSSLEDQISAKVVLRNP